MGHGSKIILNSNKKKKLCKKPRFLRNKHVPSIKSNQSIAEFLLSIDNGPIYSTIDNKPR